MPPWTLISLQWKFNVKWWHLNVWLRAEHASTCWGLLQSCRVWVGSGDVLRNSCLQILCQPCGRQLLSVPICLSGNGVQVSFECWISVFVLSSAFCFVIRVVFFLSAFMWDINIRSFGRVQNWPDEKVQGPAVHAMNWRIQVCCSAVTEASFHCQRVHQKDQHEDSLICRFLIASIKFNNSYNACPRPPERYTTLYHLRYCCMRWSGTHATTEGCGAPKRVIICMNLGSRSKSTNYMSWWSSRSSNGLHWSYTVGKGPYKGIIENQLIRKVGLSETHASGNRVASTHNEWWKANWWNKYW